MMKTMKLLMATAFATTTIVGTCIESVEAASSRGTGNEPSGSKINIAEVRYKFQIYTIDLAGNPRRDQDDNLTNNLGLFPGAIENFTGRIADANEDVKPGGYFPEFVEEKITEPSTLNLKAILIPDDRRIEYILSGEALDSRGITELALIIRSLNDIDNYSGIYDFEDIDDPIQAVNSLEYIINNQLLGKINEIRVSSKTVSSTELINQNILRSGVIKVEKTNDRIVQVPESSATNSLLALGALGMGFFLSTKRNKLNRSHP
ncbi:MULTISPECIES: hypothetical protein [Brasilonema]|nr:MULTISPECIES: hypothetical protein [Brasilonema]